MKVTLPIIIPSQRIADLMKGAIDNNPMTRVWCAGIVFKAARINQCPINTAEELTGPSPWYANPLLYDDQFLIEVHEILDDPALGSNRSTIRRHRVTHDDFAEAFKRMAHRDYARHLADFFKERDDTVTGGIFLQLVTFKVVVYG